MATPGMQVKAIVKNFTAENLINPTDHLDETSWRQQPVNCPAEKITNYAFYAQGFSAVGNAGWVQYKIDGTEYFLHIAWDVPYIGMNSFSSSIIPAGAPFQTSMTGPHRQDDNTFIVTLNHKIS
ncbi:MAG: hypothetical protein P8P74_09990 [Crocinitomicaceae bacterium]|nr:hypothetical protein [Crocinitomicaceae bacterium]